MHTKPIHDLVQSSLDDANVLDAIHWPCMDSSLWVLQFVVQVLAAVLVTWVGGESEW